MSVTVDDFKKATKVVTVGDIRKVIEGLPDEMLAGVRGWFGELNEFQFPPEVKEGALLFDHVNIGDDPE